MDPRRIPPGPGQESVWDYPRPPRIEPASRRIRVEYNGVVLAESASGMRVLETSHPPVYYVPPDSVKHEFLRRSRTMRDTVCEFKGACSYRAVEVAGKRADPVAWCYDQTVGQFDAIRGWLGFYARVCDCYLDDERATPQPGEFYGGWITSDIVGPFKGGSGTWGW